MWGLLVDIIGRKWCFNITCLLASVFGLIFAAPSNFGALCFICALIGLGVGGNIPIDATITLEFLPTVSVSSRPGSRREQNLIAFGLAEPSFPPLCSLDFPTSRSSRLVPHRLGSRPEIRLRCRPPRLWQRRRALLHQILKHGLEVLCPHSRRSHARYLPPPILCIHVPRIVRLSCFVSQS